MPVPAKPLSIPEQVAQLYEYIRSIRRQMSGLTGLTDIVVGNTDHGNLQGLADDDHPQYTLPAEVQTLIDARVLSGIPDKSVAYSDNGQLVGDVNFVWDEDTGKLHVGVTDTPGEGVLNVYSSGQVTPIHARLGSVPVAGLVPTGAGVLLTRDDPIHGSAVFMGVGASDIDSQGALYIRGVRARGSLDAPQAVQVGDRLFAVGTDAWDGTSRVGDMAQIEVVVEGTVATGRVPTRMVFATATDAAPSVLTERVRITSVGEVLIGTTATLDSGVRLQVVGAASEKTAIFRANATTPGRVLETQDSTGAEKASLDLTGFFFAGTKVVGAQGAAVADPTGGSVIDVECRAQLALWLARARATGGHGLIAD